MTSTASKPRISLKHSSKSIDSESNPQSATSELSTHRRRTAKRLVLSDDDEQDQAYSTAAVSSPLTPGHSHTAEEDSYSEHATPEPAAFPSPQHSSSSRLKRPKGTKPDGQPAKKKRVKHNEDSDEEFHAAAASGDDDLIVHTKRQSRPTAKAKANKGKGKSYTTGARDERKAGRPLANVAESNRSTTTGTKRARETSKAEDDMVDIVGDVAARPATRSPSLPKEPVDPPPKRRKLPTITKTKNPALSDVHASKTSSAAGPKTSAPPLPDLPKPTLAGSRVPPLMVGNTDFDLRDSSVYKSLFGQGGNTPLSGLSRQKKDDEKRKEMQKMREEARAKRMAETTTFFDLQAQADKIKRFEETLSRNCKFPNFLAAKWSQIHWDEEAEKKRAAGHGRNGQKEGEAPNLSPGISR